ncbi:MAG: Phosphoadenylyl-sulfate reductase (thioredoxin), Adenylyl-sulfate kinase [Myxococcales bacterium]|nr:Phosphoadenylyl-sulfate reductase (thioredoxin), Adenylyl-sulfate kinase [Myxococcales bacterium]
MIAIDVATAARSLEGESPLSILEWASKHLGSRVTFATGFGAEGCVLIDLIGRNRLPIDLFTLDTGVLFPETYALWRQLETRYGVTIRAVLPEQTLEQQAETHGPTLWTRDPDRCCEQRKVLPLRRALTSGGFDAWITAIRREQTPERADAKVVEPDHKFGLLKINPLVTWTHDDVWAHIYANDVPYNVLHERGYPSIGCQPCTSAIVPGENLRAGRWRGAGKKECGLHVATPAQAKEKP